MLKADQQHVARELREIWCDAAAAGYVHIADTPEEQTVDRLITDIMRRTDVLHEYLVGYDLVEGLVEA